MIIKLSLSVILLHLFILGCTETNHKSTDIKLHFIHNSNVLNIPFVTSEDIKEVSVINKPLLDSTYSLRVVLGDGLMGPLHDAWKMRSQLKLGLTVDDSLVAVVELVTEPVHPALVFTGLNISQVNHLRSKGIKDA